MHTHLLATTGAKYPEQLRQRIEEAIDHAFLEGNDGIVGDSDVFRTHLGAAFCNVAQPDAVLLAKGGDTIRRVQWLHLQSCRIDQEARADEPLWHVMFV